MAALSDEQARLFTEPNFGSLATIRADGGPHVTPVWVDYDGEHVLLNTAIGRAKERHLRRDPRVSVAVHDRDDPYRYVEVRGTADLVEEGAREHIDKLGKKYRGWDTYPLEPGERRVIVRIRPEKVG